MLGKANARQQRKREPDKKRILEYTLTQIQKQNQKQIQCHAQKNSMLQTSQNLSREQHLICLRCPYLMWRKTNSCK